MEVGGVVNPSAGIRMSRKVSGCYHDGMSSTSRGEQRFAAAARQPRRRRGQSHGRTHFP